MAAELIPDTNPNFARELSEDELHQILEQVGHLERCLHELKSAIAPEPGPTTSQEAPFQVEEKHVRLLLKMRRTREHQLGASLFADPAWDILLEAFAAELGGKRLSISGLAYSAFVPATTALRWVQRLEREGWLRRTRDRLDHRRQWMGLTDEGSERLKRYFAMVWPTSRSI